MSILPKETPELVRLFDRAVEELDKPPSVSFEDCFRTKTARSLNSADANEGKLNMKTLKEAVEWILNDAAYKAPESIDHEVAERWLTVLRKALDGEAGDCPGPANDHGHHPGDPDCTCFDEEAER